MVATVIGVGGWKRYEEVQAAGNSSGKAEVGEGRIIHEQRLQASSPPPSSQKSSFTKRKFKDKSMENFKISTAEPWALSRGGEAEGEGPGLAPTPAKILICSS